MSSLVNWLYVDFNSYFASVEQHLNPKLRHKPIAVVPMKTDSTCVIAASYEAKKFGIKTGTMVGDAKKMCPGLILITGDHVEYVKFHKKLIEVIESCHPVAGVMSIDEVSCALGGRDRNLKNAIELSHEIKQKIYKEVGESFSCSIGLAPNRFLAKVASDMQKPNGLTYILPEEIPHKLYRLQLRDLIGIGHNMEVRLNRHGVYSVEKLYTLSIHELRSVWGGVGGERFYKWLRGEDLNISHRENQSISHQHVLPPDKRNAQGVYLIGQKLLNKAAVRLRKINAWARHLSVAVKYTDRTYWWNELKMSECQDTFSLQEAFDQLWTTFRHQGAPMKITVALTQLIEDDERNFSFFDNSARIQLSYIMDKVNAKYGKNTLYLGSIHEALDSAPMRISFSSIPDVEI